MLSERELQNNPNDRRSFIKLLAAAPLFASIGARSFAAAVAATAKALGLSAAITRSEDGTGCSAASSSSR